MAHEPCKNGYAIAFPSKIPYLKIVSLKFKKENKTDYLDLMRKEKKLMRLSYILLINIGNFGSESIF